MNLPCKLNFNHKTSLSRRPFQALFTVVGSFNIYERLHQQNMETEVFNHETSPSRRPFLCFKLTTKFGCGAVCDCSVAVNRFTWDHCVLLHNLRK